MPLLYVNNESYPELRNVQSRWARTVIWWRAILHAARGDLWLFVVIQIAVVAVWFALYLLVSRVVRLPATTLPIAGPVVIVLAMVSLAYAQVSLGGDMMRRHLRAVSSVARYACPSCGQSLRGHLHEDTRSSVRCPECGETTGMSIFEPPFVIPRRHRAFPPWSRTREPGAAG